MCLGRFDKTLKAIDIQDYFCKMFEKPAWTSRKLYYNIQGEGVKWVGGSNLDVQGGLIL